MAEEVGDTHSAENNHSPEVLTASALGHLLGSAESLLYCIFVLYNDFIQIDEWVNNDFSPSTP